MLVVLDTNIWQKELALNSALGAALRFFMKAKSARLAVPEVVRREVEHNLRQLIDHAIDSVEKGNRQLLALFGSLKEIVLPTPEQADELIKQVFAKVGVEILEMPFGLESARSAFEKTIRKQPPCHNAQQFKDAVIWADAVALLATDDVILATQDKAFFAGGDPKNGLAKNLLKEAAGHAHRLQVVSSLNELLEHVAEGAKIDRPRLATSVLARVCDAVDRLLTEVGGVVAGPPVPEFELYATEDPKRLYFTYSLRIPCDASEGSERSEIEAIATGNGLIRVPEEDIVETHPSREQIVFKESDGEFAQRSNVYASGSMVLGHRTVEHRVRHRLDGVG